MFGIEVSVLISVMVSLTGIYLSYRNLKRGLDADAEVRRKAAEQRKTEEAKNHTEITIGIDALNTTLREVKEKINAMEQRIDTTADRITRAEESAKSAHKRIDRLENSRKGWYEGE